MNRTETLDSYAHTNGRITSPGKFEGEPVFTPALWDLACQGFADRDNSSWYWFSIPKNDPLRVEWPELDTFLGRCRTIRLHEDETGFVHTH